jgi:L,D-transpeptidase catalytic domain
MKTWYLICLIIAWTAIFTSCSIFNKNKSRKFSTTENKTDSSLKIQNSLDDLSALALKGHLDQAIKYAQQNKYSTEYFFLIDMGICSGKNRFFVYDMKTDTVVLSGLVAHGNCNTHLLEQAKFSNSPNCGCSSLGKYKVGSAYRGEFGKSYRLYGLDSTNSNAFKRAIVLHGFDPVPDQEIYPQILCNSFGCPMVSRVFLAKLSTIIDNSDKPILLWIYN